jgi:hypothetical protein
MNTDGRVVHVVDDRHRLANGVKEVVLVAVQWLEAQPNPGRLGDWRGGSQCVDSNGISGTSLISARDMMSSDATERTHDDGCPDRLGEVDTPTQVLHSRPTPLGSRLDRSNAEVKIPHRDAVIPASRIRLPRPAASTAPSSVIDSPASSKWSQAQCAHSLDEPRRRVATEKET